MTRFVRENHQTLAFTRSRRGAEVVAQYARRRLAGCAPELEDRVAAYRAGYLPEERRALEVDLSSGRLLGIAATNALELGIDIGGLDAVVLNGFPGTLASMWQQAGRAGRTGRRSAAVLVAGDDQLDQWYAAHPTELTRRAPERAVVNPQNPYIVRAQVACAANELPLSPDDERWFGPALDDAVRDLVRDDLLTPRAGRMYWSGERSPARDVGLRSGSSVEYRMLDAETERTIGTVDDARVFSVAHPGAVYLHQGRQYRVDHLDRDEHLVILEPYDDADEYTQARTTTDITIVREDAFASLGDAIVHLGSVEVRNQVVAFQRKRISTNGVIEVCELDLPERALVTRACWYTIPPEVVEAAGIDADGGRRRGARGGARSDRDAAALHDLRPLGRRRRVDGAASADRAADHLRVRRLSRRRRHRRARVRRGGAARACDARPHRRMLVRRRVPVVRAVPQVRELERVSRQAGRGRTVRGDGPHTPRGSGGRRAAGLALAAPASPAATGGSIACPESSESIQPRSRRRSRSSSSSRRIIASRGSSESDTSGSDGSDSDGSGRFGRVVDEPRLDRLERRGLGHRDVEHARLDDRRPDDLGDRFRTRRVARRRRRRAKGRCWFGLMLRAQVGHVRWFGTGARRARLARFEPVDGNGPRPNRGEVAVGTAGPRPLGRDVLVDSMRLDELDDDIGEPYQLFGQIDRLVARGVGPSRWRSVPRGLGSPPSAPARGADLEAEPRPGRDQREYREQGRHASSTTA